MVRNEEEAWNRDTLIKYVVLYLFRNRVSLLTKDVVGSSTKLRLNLILSTKSALKMVNNVQEHYLLDKCICH